MNMTVLKRLNMVLYSIAVLFLVLPTDQWFGVANLHFIIIPFLDLAIASSGLFKLDFYLLLYN
ncbi:hypothetical protein [Streptococcus ruminantium]|uniref:hypothetical protein n=1 Tax=Streptococcus ruminantium TaxID=1917441 RepID=UPI001F3B2C0D|nr:hypothetical protein [Streptococcus ruminantium]BDD40755.1 hypothetical protein GUT184_10190 [Streptococcus ruminantium]